jgi:hypothetical protein
MLLLVENPLPSPKGGSRGASCPLRPLLLTPSRPPKGEAWGWTPPPRPPAFSPLRCLDHFGRKQMAHFGRNLTPQLFRLSKQASGKNRSAGGGRGTIVLSTCIPPASARSVPQSRAGIGQRDEVMLAPLRRGRAGACKLPPPCNPRLRSGGHAFAGRTPPVPQRGKPGGVPPPPGPPAPFPPPPPTGGNWGASCPLQPPLSPPSCPLKGRPGG